MIPVDDKMKSHNGPDSHLGRQEQGSAANDRSLRQGHDWAVFVIQRGKANLRQVRIGRWAHDLGARFDSAQSVTELPTR